MKDKYIILIICTFLTNTLFTTEISLDSLLIDDQKTLPELREHFQNTKPAFYIDCHDVFAHRNDTLGRARFMRDTLPSLGAKVLFALRVAGAIMNPLVIGNIIWLGIKDKESGFPTEKRKVAENYHYFIKRWWSEALYKQLIQYSTDIYETNIEMINTLYKLKEAGCPIYLFSNGGYDTIKAIENDHRFEKYFKGDNRLFSDTPTENQSSNSINDTYQTEYRIAKPSPASFIQALKKHAVEPGNAIMVDDSLKKTPHHSNPKLGKRYPDFKNYWACSIHYDPENHSSFETAIKELGLLQN